MAYSSYSNGLNVQATPSRDRDRHPFPQSTHPSPGPSLRQSSTSSASNSATHLPSTAGVAAPTPSMSTHTVLTPDHFLKQHSTASNPALAALEQAVADRNVLSGQNTQLWKLIEKQRAGYNQILKELERIRGERDSYKGRLAALSALPPSTDKRQNNASTSTSNTTGAAVGERGSRPSIDTISSQMSSNSSGVSQPQQRQLLPRQYSDGTPSTAAPRNGTHQLHSSRSLDPITSSANHGSGNNSDSGLITTPRRSNSPSPLNVASSRQHRAPPAPLVVPGHEDNHAAYTISHSPESAISTRQPGGGYEAGSAGSQGGGAGYATTTTTRPPDSPSTATPKPQGQSQAQMQAAAYPRKSSLADSISSVVTGSSILSLSSGSSHFYGSQANVPQQQPQSNYTSPPPPSAPPVLENPFARAGSGAGGGVNTRALGPTSSSPAIIQASSSGSTSGNSVNGNTPSPLAQPPYVPQQQQQPLLDTRSPPHFLSRDSRISLPDEASRYIQNMSDSPAASPRTDVFPAPRSKLSNTVFPPQSMDPLARESEFLDMDDDAEEDGHGERSEDGSEDGDEIGGEADTTAGADNPGFDSSSTTTGATRSENNNSTMNNTDSEGFSYPYPHAEYMNNYSSQSNSSREDIIGGYGSGSGYSGGRKDNKSASSSRVGIDEFPLPPPSNPYHQRPPGAELAYNSNGPAPSQQGYQQQQQQGQSSLSTPSRAQAASGAKQGQAGADQSYHYNSSGAHSAGEASHLHPTSMQDAVTAPGPVGASPYLTPPAMQQPSVSSSSSISSSTHQQPQSQSQSQSVQKPAASTASFRALPLISTDLPHTTITVSHSFVRPNDRGKEVLSFIVFVNPGSGKEGWKVEKMYSDVLSLDQRVRNSVGKAVVKKIMTLPEGKLWKDHAPAKVDQRKAVLETYLQSLIQLPVKNNDEVIAFFTTDIIREQKQAVMQVGHKEGYLTKKGKNFGGWKTRFFVLQGPVLEYYDCRGGAHLGSIMITGAQIARQHRTERAPNADDETEYRHAFLIVESKKGPGGNHPRHVLCAESDDDRDSWVEMLVRYYTGTYSEDLVFNPASGLTSVQSPAQPRASTSSNDVASRTKPMMARGDTKGSSISLAASDDFLRSSSPSSRSIDPSPVDRQGPSAAGGLDIPKRAMDRSNLGLPSSLPDSSPLSAAQNFMQDVATTGQRANSEQGHYPDLLQQQSSQDSRRKGSSRQHSPEQHRQRSGDDSRKTFQPSLSTVNPSPTSAAPPGSQPPERVPSPEKPESKVKISGPMNGTPIPSGFKFGGKDAPSSEQAQAASDRREKAKSRSFWGFGKMNGDKAQAHANFPPRAVFGVTLEDALEVAQICNLPAIVFRCIQYLEAKKADQEEGIYRLSGSSAVIKNLKDMFNNEGDIDLLASDEYWDPHAIAGLLKSFLRELPSSILTRDLHLKFLAVIDIPDAQERIRELSHLIAALPLANYSLLRALTAHLILIVQNAPINKMTMRNVGIVFSPTLGIPAGVFSLMLGEFNRVFNVDGDNTEGEGAGGATGEGAGAGESKLLENPVSELKRNSRQYTDAAADQMLGLGGRTLKKSTADEAHSDVGDSASMIDHDESGTDAITITTESADAPGTVESSATSASPASNQETDAAYDYNSYDYESSGITVVPPAAEPTDAPASAQATPMKTPSKASTTAANRGLNVTVTMSERGNRHSRMIGLPASPRPTTTSTSMSGMAQTASGSSGDAHTTDS